MVQAFIFTCYPPPGRRFRTATGPGVYRHSLSAARKAYPDRDWSRRLSSLVIRHKEGVSGSRVVQAFTLTRYPPPGRRIGTPSGPGVHLHSLSAARKAYPDPEWSRRSSALAIRLQKVVSGPRVVQPFIFTHCPPPGRRFQTVTGPTVHLHSLSAARKAHPDPEWSSRSSSLAIRCQEGVSGPRLVQVIIFTRYPPPGSRTRTRVVQPFIFTRYPPPGRRIRTPSGPAVHPHSLSASRKAYRDPEWSRRSSALAIRLQEGVSGPRVIQPFIFSRYPLPGRRIRTPSCPGVRPHSLSASRKSYRDPEWSSRSFSLTVRHRGGVSRPRPVLPFIFTRYPPPGRRTQTPSGPGVHLHSLSAARKPHPDPSGPTVHLHSLSATRKAYPDPEWSSRSSALAIRLQKGVSGPRVVQAFIRTRYPPPERRIGTPSGPGVHPHSLSASRKAYRDPEWSSRSSSLAARCQEGVSGPWMVQPFIFTRCPPPGRRIRTPSDPAVHLHSLSAARKPYPDRGWSSRSSSLAIRRQEAYPDPEWSRRSSSLAIRRQEGVS